MAGSYLCNVFRSLFPGALSSRARRLGSRCAFYSRNGTRIDRDTFLRTHDDRIRRRRRFSHLNIAALDND